MDRSRIADSCAAPLGCDLAGDGREFDHRRDTRRLCGLMRQSGGSGLVVQCALPEPFSVPCSEKRNSSASITLDFPRPLGAKMARLGFLLKSKVLDWR